MEKFLSNDVIRNFILKMIFNDGVKNIEVDENFHIYLVSQEILEMYNSDIKLLQNIANGIFEIAYLDAYKVLNLKNRESNLTYEEIEIYNKISSILNFQELENAVLSIDTFLEDLLKYVLEFYRYNILRKIKTVKALTSAQCASLLYNFKLKIDNYENNSLDSLILEEVLINDNYLDILVDGIILTKGDNLYLDKSIINEQMVDDYYTKNLKPQK